MTSQLLIDLIYREGSCCILTTLPFIRGYSLIKFNGSEEMYGSLTSYFGFGIFSFIPPCRFWDWTYLLSTFFILRILLSSRIILARERSIRDVYHHLEWCNVSFRYLGSEKTPVQQYLMKMYPHQFPIQKLSRLMEPIWNNHSTRCLRITE